MAPALSLLALAPLIAEYLLGSLTFAQMTLFPLMVLLYGAGAVFVREVTVRSGRGWPTILVLGVAYGLVEEGIATQSLFNPNYLHMHLIAFGYMPSLGTALPWDIYVVALHAVWSIIVPIGLVELLFPLRRRQPWLGNTGLSVIALLFALGIAAVTTASWRMGSFFASPAQLGASAALAAAVAAAAFALFRPGAAAPAPSQPAGLPWALGAFALVIGSAFHLLNYGTANTLTPAAVVAGQLALIGVVLAVLAIVSRSAGWTRACGDGVVVGLLLVYFWWGFRLTYVAHGPSSVLGHCFPAGVVAVLLGVAYYRSRTPLRA
jgi:hypothetical protein